MDIFSVKTMSGDIFLAEAQTHLNIPDHPLMVGMMERAETFRGFIEVQRFIIMH
jgi:hypothetical protein